jgi:hypothetical protein
MAVLDVEELRNLLLPGLRLMHEGFSLMQNAMTDLVARKNAHEKGLALLREWLSPEQLSDFDHHGHFYVVGSVSGIKYRIRLNTPYNIDVMSGTEIVKQLCFGPEGIDCIGDLMLAQKLAIELCEGEALRATNVRPPGGIWAT